VTGVVRLRLGDRELAHGALVVPAAVAHPVGPGRQHDARARRRRDVERIRGDEIDLADPEGTERGADLGDLRGHVAETEMDLGAGGRDGVHLDIVVPQAAGVRGSPRDAG